MSHRHQSSRRRSYGRRQHELHERRGRRDEPRVREWAIEDEVLQSGGFLPAQDDGTLDAGGRPVGR